MFSDDIVLVQLYAMYVADMSWLVAKQGLCQQ